ncbi:hypothetical protein HOD88_02585 [archaeon]|jgi:hypothetical protein|nr:hypothetical protein [archaeon]
MKLVGFNFNKISVEKSKEKNEKIKISSNIEIAEIKEVVLKLVDSKEKILNVSFSYLLKYEPDFAKVEFEGSILLSIEEKMAEEILKKWEDKETAQDFKLAVLNVIFKKCNVKALQLEEELNLPFHMPMASLKSSK